MTGHTGFTSGLDGLARLSHAKTRSISAENPTGEKSKGEWLPKDRAQPPPVSWVKAGKLLSEPEGVTGNLTVTPPSKKIATYLLDLGLRSKA